MKKSILTALAIELTVLAFAQNIPANMLKGIEVKTDEFTGATTYSAQNCCLSITRTKDDATMYISLSCASVDVPVKLKSIIILTNGETTTIDRNDFFSIREMPVRVMRSASTGKFGTSSYKGATFETRNQYIEEWKTDAQPYIATIESIIANLGKVKFDGENNTLYLEFKKKDARNMEAIMRLYKYLQQY